MKPLLVTTAVTTLLITAALGQTPTSQQPDAVAQGDDFDIADMSLEDLLEIEVEVGSRQAQSLASTAASVFVLNEADIRRSGMRSVPELLRLVPGLIVAQDVPGAYGFSSRLGEYEFAGMLVLIDGQRLYTTLLRREYWQAIDLPLEIIERIEVVRGPGGSRWGDRASQGVINIVTKRAGDRTQGLRLTGWTGSEERLGGSFRYGESVDEDVAFYLHGKLARRDGGYPDVSGDRWSNDSIGGRVDIDVDDGVHLTVDGIYHDSFLGDSYEILPGYSSLNMIVGGHLKSKLRAEHDDGSWTEWRVGLDGYDQDIRDYYTNVPYEFLRYREELFDTMLMHSRELGPGHRVTVGAVLRSLTVEYQLVLADVGNEYNETRGDVFLSWDWDLSDSVRLTLGGNIGYQDGRRSTGVDTQPDLRLSWQPSEATSLWTALSTNREPDTKIPDSGLLVHRKASRLHAWEIGARHRIGDSLLLRADAYAYAITNQVNGTLTDPGSGATLYQTSGRTDAFGGELHAAWKPSDTTRLSVWAAHTNAHSQNIDPGSFILIEDEVPKLRCGLTAGFNPVPGLELDTHVLYTEAWSNIPTWWRVDLRLAWRATEDTSVELVGQNLTDPQHQEYFYDEQVQRGGYLMVTHRF